MPVTVSELPIDLVASSGRVLEQLPGIAGVPPLAVPEQGIDVKQQVPQNLVPEHIYAFPVTSCQYRCNVNARRNIIKDQSEIKMCIPESVKLLNGSMVLWPTYQSWLYLTVRFNVVVTSVVVFTPMSSGSKMT